MQHLEYDHQTSFIAWCRKSVNKYPLLDLIYCNHNTQKLTKPQMGRWKALGGRAGVPDIFLPVRYMGRTTKLWDEIKQYSGLYLEFKNPNLRPKTSRSKGGISDEQLDFMKKVSDQGYLCYVVYDWQDAKKIVESYLDENIT